MSRLSHEAQTGDLLSDLLRTVRLRGDGAVHLAPERPYTIEFGTRTGMVHIFERGDCKLRVEGIDQPFAVREGDIALVPRPRRHVIALGAHRRPHEPRPEDLVLDQERARTSPRWLSGSYQLEAPSGGHLLAELPEVIVLTGLGDRVLDWLDLSRRMLLEEIEAPGQGSGVMVSRILDLLFVQIVRAWASRPGADPSWMSGAMDPQIGRVLTDIHADPARPWTVAALARRAHLSRSAFAQRFAERVGRTPAAYVAELRLELAADQLRVTGDPVNVIATTVGYRSGAAFTRAFTKRFGVAPREWRSGGGNG